MIAQRSVHSGQFNVEVVQEGRELARAGADIFLKCAKNVLKIRPRFTVVLSGGNTPRLIYETLGAEGLKSGISWERVHFFWGDERNVPPDHRDNNFHMAWMTILSRLPIPMSNIHRIKTELLRPQVAAEEYENTLRSFFGLRKASEKPHFDLVFLGLGTDGHTASLFPDGQPNTSISKEEPDRLVIAPWIAHLNDFRISLTPSVLNESSRVVFLVSGSQKASILESVLIGGEAGRVYPAQAIQPNHGQLTWLVDKAAAASLKEGVYK